MTQPPITRSHEVLVYSNPWLRVYFDEVVGPRGPYRQTRLAGPRDDLAGAVVVAKRPDGRVAFVRIYRYPSSRWLLELPRGYAEADETATQTGSRELLEETGLEAQDAHQAGSFVTDSGLMGDPVAVVTALVGTADEVAPDAGEAIDEVCWLSAEQIEDAIATGQIADAITLAALRVAGV